MLKERNQQLQEERQRNSSAIQIILSEEEDPKTLDNNDINQLHLDDQLQVIDPLKLTKEEHNEGLIKRKKEDDDEAFLGKEMPYKS